MNPLGWKREHQVALAICAAIGFAFAFIFGLREINPYGHSMDWRDYNSGAYHSINFYWPVVVMVGIFGALVGGGVIYAVQMMRR